MLYAICAYKCTLITFDIKKSVTFCLTLYQYFVNQATKSKMIKHIRFVNLHMAVTTNGNMSNLVAVGKMNIRVQFVNFSTGNVFDIKKITAQIRIFTFMHCMCIFAKHNVVPDNVDGILCNVVTGTFLYILGINYAMLMP